MTKHARERSPERCARRRSSMLIVVAAIAWLGGCAQEARPTRPAFYASLAAPGATIDATSARDLINGYRASLGLAPVSVDPDLMRFAAGESAALAAAGDVAASRRAPLQSRLESVALGVTARENVSAGYYTISDAFSGWRGSPTHDAVLRMPTARRFGIATAYNPQSRHKVFWSLVMAE